MKNLILFSLITGFVSAHAAVSSFKKLAEVNSVWKEQPKKVTDQLPDYRIQSERDWIKLHLSLVEKTLREKQVSLRPEQIAKRNQMLDALHVYWNEGAFPVNDLYSYRTPIFIDRYNNFCAVGALMKASGNEAIARKISQDNNLIYVRQMKYPEVVKWAGEYGFSIDELAWIQPGYPPVSNFVTVAGGTNGTIYCMYPAADGSLYVGGDFTMVGGNVPANRIAKLTVNGGSYVWQAVGLGVDSTVKSIAEYQGKLWIAGSFTRSGSTSLTQVAYWDQGSWQAGGCTYGTVNALKTFNGKLYAGGDFDVCAAMSEVNFAQWDDTFRIWKQVHGIDGKVNGLTTYQNRLLIYGDFTCYLTGTAHQNVLAFDEVNFTYDTTGLPPLMNETHSMFGWNNELYAGLEFISNGDTAAVKRLVNGAWETYVPVFNTTTLTGFAGEAIYAMYEKNGVFCYGGDFLNTAFSMMTSSQNFTATDSSAGEENYGLFDRPIRCFTYWNNMLLIGGAFENVQNAPVMHLCGKTTLPRLNGTSSIEEPTALSLQVFPNPVGRSEKVSVASETELQSITIFNQNGQKVQEVEVGGQKNITFHTALSAGLYQLVGKDVHGKSFYGRIAIR